MPVALSVQIGTWNVGLTGTLPAFASPPAVVQSGTWNIGSITTLPALSSGTNAIGSVTVTSLPAVTQSGTWTVGLASLPALSSGTNAIGSVTVTSIPAVVQSGTWNIGSITTLPALSSGTNAIGSVTVTSLPAVTQSGTWNIGSITTLPALPTGSNIIGAATASYTGLSLTPTVTAVAHATNTTIGSLLTFSTTLTSGLIQSVVCSFTSGIIPTLDIIFFRASPTSTTVTDASAVAVNVADVAKIIGIMHLTDASLVGASSPSIVQAQSQGLEFAGLSGNIYAIIVNRGASVTLGSTTDLNIYINIVQ